MKIQKYRIEDFKGGWFIGDFDPSLLKTKDFEVSIKLHPKGEAWDIHYHKVATEYNYVVSGRVKIEDEVYETGDLFVVEPNYVMDPEFLEDCTIVCVKTPSIVGDKYVLER